MRYQIVQYGEDKGLYFSNEKNFAYRCINCGGLFYGTVFEVKRGRDTRDERALRNELKQLNPNKEDHLPRIELLNSALEEVKHNTEAAEVYMSAIGVEKCPLCGTKLCRDNEHFISHNRSEAHLFRVSEKLKRLEHFANEEDRIKAKENATAYIELCDLPNVNSSVVTLKDKGISGEHLKEYILHLIHLENNIYFLSEQLTMLYDQHMKNERALIRKRHEPAFFANREVEELRFLHEQAQKEVYAVEQDVPHIPKSKKPKKPAKPELKTPGFFNKRAVMAENEALLAKYENAVSEYQERLSQYEELLERKRLDHEDAIAEARRKADAAKATLDEALARAEEEQKAMATRPIPAEVIKQMLDKEIEDTEKLLKKTYAARNELYACDIIFGKYRDAVPLSSFYEYLLSGRCESLEGANGAYNIYESEIRANRIIDQLDTVISSLEDIKQNQYMMYQELRNINTSLQRLNHTMDKVLTSIQGIEANTTSMNEYMEYISQNSAVIAHNTAVTAYYSKVEAELTNALGYMVAFK